MQPSFARFAVGIAVTLACTGCQVLFGFERAELVQEVPPGCTLPDRGDGSVRLAHLIPGDELVDLCVRRQDDTFDEVHPVLDTAGRDCPTGIAYKEVTAPIGLTPGNYVFRAIAADDECGAAPIAEIAAEIDAGAVVTLALVGSAETDASLSALPEAPAAADALRLRFVHAMADQAEQPLEAGLVGEATVPPVITVVFRDVPFGGVAPAGPGLTEDVDAFGYTDVGGRTNLSVQLAARATGESAALATQFTALTSSESYTLYGIGDGAEHPHELWLCAESAPTRSYLMECGQPVDISVEAFATQLTDYFMSDVDQREPAFVTALQSLDADLVCLSEVYVPEFLTAIAAAATDRYWVLRGDDPQLTITGDLSLRGGGDPVAAEIPCAGGSASAATALLGCIANKCSEDGETFPAPGDRALDCLGNANKCATLSLPLVYGGSDSPGPACWGCLVPALAAGRTFSETSALCTTASPADERWVFGRNPGVVALARRDVFEPIAGEVPELARLPSFSWQKGLLTFPLRAIENGATLDFLCTHFTYQAKDDNPYVGPYGEGESGPTGAAAEQRLQAERTLSFIDARRAITGRRVILAGELYSSPEPADDDEPGVTAFRSETLAILASALQPLVAAEFSPQCTWCQRNPLVCNSCGDDPESDRSGYWFAHLFARGLRASQVETTEITRQELLAPGVDFDGQIPASPSYGLKSRLRLTQ